MRASLTCLIFSIISACDAYATEADNPFPLSVTNVTWDADSKITELYGGENEAHFTFNFTNVSSRNLIISSAQPSCGCTTVQLPSLPWTLSPGAVGKIDVAVNIHQEKGVASNSVLLISDQGMKVLSVNVNVIPPINYPLTSDAQRQQNKQASIRDRQSIFKVDCVDCHVQPGNEKMGVDLYVADCAICHEGPNRDRTIPNLHYLVRDTDVEFWRSWIAYGRPHSLMPGFAVSEGGPLTDQQITSLAVYLKTLISPSH